MSIKKVDLKPEESLRRNQLREEKPYVYEKIMQYPNKLERGESTAIIQFQYDYICNFRCQHCSITDFQNNKKRRFFTLEDAKELSRQADEMGLAQITITGGEPLFFRDFDQLVEALDPQKFYIATDSNGWFLDIKMAHHLKNIGVDKIHLSLDSMDAKEHDDFRGHSGSHKRVIQAIDAVKDVGLNLLINTVVTKQRVRSQEFLEYLDFMKEKDVPTLVLFPKLVGLWEGRLDILIDRDDAAYVRELEKKYKIFTHLSSFNGINFGCPAVKRMVSLTKYGDIMPCPWIYTSMGNFFKEPLKDIMARGLGVKYFGKRMESCLSSENMPFIEKYIIGRIHGKETPVPFDEVFFEDDMLVNS